MGFYAVLEHFIYIATGLKLKINAEQPLTQSESLSPLSLEIVENDYTMPSPGVVSSTTAIPLLGVPRLITDIPTTGCKRVNRVTRESLALSK